MSVRVANVVVCVVVVESSLFVVVAVGFRLETLWVSFLFEGLGKEYFVVILVYIAKLLGLVMEESWSNVIGEAYVVGICL